MRDKERRSAVQEMNVGDSDFALRHGEFIGEVERVMTVDNEERTPAAREEDIFIRAATMSTSRW